MIRCAAITLFTCAGLLSRAHIAYGAPCDLAIERSPQPLASAVLEELASTGCIDELAAFDPNARPWVLRVVTPSLVEVWSAGTLRSEIRLPADETVSAVKVAEHVHALRGRALRAPRVSTPEVRRGPVAGDHVAIPDDPIPAVNLGVAAGVAHEGSGMSLVATVQGRMRIAGAVGAGLTLGLPLAASRVERGDSSADVSTAFGGAFIDAEYAPSPAGVRARAGLAALVARTVTAGTAAAPLQGRTDTSVGFIPAIMLGAGYAISSRVEIGAQALAGFRVPTAEVRFDGERAFVWGAPYFATTLGIRVGL